MRRQKSRRRQNQEDKNQEGEQVKKEIKIRIFSLNVVLQIRPDQTR